MQKVQTAEYSATHSFIQMKGGANFSLPHIAEILLILSLLPSVTMGVKSLHCRCKIVNGLYAVNWIFSSALVISHHTGSVFFLCLPSPLCAWHLSLWHFLTLSISFVSETVIFSCALSVPIHQLRCMCTVHVSSAYALQKLLQVALAW